MLRYDMIWMEELRKEEMLTQALTGSEPMTNKSLSK